MPPFSTPHSMVTRRDSTKRQPWSRILTNFNRFFFCFHSHIWQFSWLIPIVHLLCLHPASQGLPELGWTESSSQIPLWKTGRAWCGGSGQIRGRSVALRAQAWLQGKILSLKLSFPSPLFKIKNKHRTMINSYSVSHFCFMSLRSV